MEADEMEIELSDAGYDDFLNDFVSEAIKFTRDLTDNNLTVFEPVRAGFIKAVKKSIEDADDDDLGMGKLVVGDSPEAFAHEYVLGLLAEWLGNMLEQIKYEAGVFASLLDKEFKDRGIRVEEV